jgi:hypothetical protein
MNSTKISKRFQVNSGAGIRTPTKRTRTSCATVTPPPNYWSRRESNPRPIIKFFMSSTSLVCCNNKRVTNKQITSFIFQLNLRSKSVGDYDCQRILHQSFGRYLHRFLRLCSLIRQQELTEFRQLKRFDLVL